MENILGWFGDLPAWLAAVTAVVTAATAVTALTPSKTDDKILSKVLWGLNMVAGNFGRNKNADG